MGCGKTLTAISVAGAGFQMGKVHKVLIAAPTSVCAVWPKEFQEYASFRYTIRTLLGDKHKRIKTHDAEQSKAMHKLGDQARYKMCNSQAFL